ncbi:MAG: hypothetical protein K2H04_01835 [Bacteroidaceae bacterium]|nr:hypothetical protein [Bacteroidaceae bacterium]
MSPTPIGRSRGHRSVGVGDSDLEAVKARHTQKRPAAHITPSRPMTEAPRLSPNRDKTNDGRKQDLLAFCHRHVSKRF